ncbi:hypothetical protein KR009_000815 [Drosophila setifemur]|nr:hypothetical protein KR009_000815 [Drosophila setifemur]
MPYYPANSYDADLRIWSGDHVEPFFDKNLSVGEVIFEEMRRHPQLIAQVRSLPNFVYINQENIKPIFQISPTENTVLTREELHANSMRVASYMRFQGLHQSDVVGIIARNTTHLPAVAYACFFNGIAFHSLNITYDQGTIRNLFDITKPRLIFCDGDEFEKVRVATSHLDVKIITMRNHPSGSITINDVLTTPIEENFQPAKLEQGNDQSMAILCSSGTTGTPKAVTIANSRNIVKTNEHLTTADIQFSHNTLDWITGLITTVTSGMYSTTRIIADNAFDPAFVLRIIKEYKATWTIQPPSALAIIANCPEFETCDLSSLRTYVFGGSRASVEIQQRIRSRLSRDCLHFMYGLTELGSIASSNFHFDEKPNSVGRLISGTQLKVLNDRGETLGPNEVGELCLRNGQHWKGYFGNQKVSQEIRDPQGWFHSGDLGYMDNEGFLFVVDRQKDMLKYQNIMYYPNEIESLISEMPEVAEVCVFGVPSDIYGDEAAANVVKKHGSQLTAEDIVDYVVSRTDSKYKQMNGGVLIVDDLLRSANGKTNRVANKAHYLHVKNIS